METLEIHSKSFLIKWVTAPNDSVISWQIKPNKKSIQFGLYKKTKDVDFSDNTSTYSSSNQNQSDSSLSLPRGGAAAAPPPPTRERSSSNVGTIEERLARNGLSKVQWQGRCEPDEYLRGRHEVQSSAGGVYALVFDNTFSKTTAKTVLFSHRVEKRGNETQVVVNEPDSIENEQATCVSDGRYLRGMLLKKRRKRLQGYARRYFALDYKQGLLNYYLDQRSSFLRGSMPISMCVVSAREASKEMFIDSGMEVWSIKAVNMADFKTWVQALDVARTLTSNNGIDSSMTTTVPNSPARTSLIKQKEDEWNAVRKLVEQLDEIKAKSSSILEEQTSSSAIDSLPASPIPPPVPSSPPIDGPKLQRRPSFWKRKRSKEAKEAKEQQQKSPLLNSGSPFSSANASSTSLGVPPAIPTLSSLSSPHPLVKEIDRELEDVINEFKAIFAKNDKFKDVIAAAGIGAPASIPPTARPSMDGGESVWSADEFFDAHEAFDGVVYVDDSDNERDGENDDNDERAYGMSTIAEKTAAPVGTKLWGDSGAAQTNDRRVPEEFEFEDDSSDESDGQDSRLMKDVSKTHKIASHDLYPLPHDLVKRQNNFEGTDNGPPPSLMSVLRKNVGKDMSSIPMPVTFNEPITLLQRQAELMEYSELLDRAVASSDMIERAMLIASFSFAYVSGFRARERCTRKPFNPMLGETYELVREDKGFRLVCEKVSHRPVVLAMQVESADWTLNYNAKPNQKFWGKTYELTDAGPIRITINKTGETFEYLLPSMFMRNLIAGEKYIEPVGVCNVFSSSGAKATVEYKSGGMFKGRSEELTVRGFDALGVETSSSFSGKWTDNVVVASSTGRNAARGSSGSGSSFSSGDLVWKTGQLVEGYEHKYGFTEWVASLNEVTEIERDKLPPTDSRMRPDRLLYERGQVDEAEKVKQQLEQAQRERRTKLEKSKGHYTPTFFHKVVEEEEDDDDDDDSEGRGVWVLKSDKDNYWYRRRVGDWSNLPPIW